MVEATAGGGLRAVPRVDGDDCLRHFHAHECPVDGVLFVGISGNQHVDHKDPC